MIDNFRERAIEYHKGGKLAIIPKVPLESKEDLAIAYTPGVAEPCKVIAENKDKVFDYTSKWNFVAIVSDGSAVLGLGNIGAYAAIPVMEGKALLFKKFADIDAFPICLKTQDVDEIVKIVENIEPVFGGINLEDISAPRCFEIEQKLKERLDIPVFHDDQHGTAIVVLGALINALKLVGKGKDVKIVINGAGAAGVAITKLLLKYSFKNIIVCDSKGIISKEREDLNPAKKEIAKLTNKENLQGSLKDALKGADVFIGVSAPNLLKAEDISKMQDNAIVFALANPIPEIMPEEARKGGAKIVGTGRSDFPNQINNALAFPGVFRGALDCRAREINDGMKIAAAEAIASYVKEDELKEEYIVPSVLDEGVHKAVAEAVKRKAIELNVARI